MRRGVVNWRRGKAGWFNHSAEHRLARQGIRVRSHRSGTLARIGDIPITAKPLPKGMVYPVAPDEVKNILSTLPRDDLNGLKSIEFVPPKDKQQEGAWAQWIRSRNAILIFGQKASKDGKISGQDARRVRDHMKNYVVKHEVGHQYAVRKLGTDKRLSLAEARADGYAFGMGIEEKNVKQFEQYHK
jgi:hypothetical protein